MSDFRKLLRENLYQLKREYPAKIAIYKESGQVYDPGTGKQTANRSRVIIKRAIVLPSLLSSSPHFALASISADRDFAYGGNFPITDRPVIVDGKDLPPGYEITLDNYVVFEHNRYDIKSIEEISPNLGWLMICRLVNNATLPDILDETLTDSMNLNEVFEGSIGA